MLQGVVGFVFNFPYEIVQTHATVVHTFLVSNLPSTQIVKLLLFMVVIIIGYYNQVYIDDTNLNIQMIH